MKWDTIRCSRAVTVLQCPYQSWVEQNGYITWLANFLLLILLTMKFVLVYQQDIVDSCSGCYHYAHSLLPEGLLLNQLFPIPYLCRWLSLPNWISLLIYRFLLENISSVNRDNFEFQLCPPADLHCLPASCQCQVQNIGEVLNKLQPDRPQSNLFRTVCFCLDNNHKELLSRFGHQLISLPSFWTSVETLFI